MKRLASVAIVVGSIAMIPAVALAAPGGKGGGKDGGKTGGSALVIPDATYGSTVTATVSTTKPMTWIEGTCYQDGRPVIYNRIEVDENGHAPLEMGPTSGYTTGMGGADCTSEAKYWNAKRSRWISLGVAAHHVGD